MALSIGTPTRTLSLPPQYDWALTWQPHNERASAATQPIAKPLAPEMQYEGWYRGPLTIAVPYLGALPHQRYVQTNYPRPQYDDSSLGTMRTDRVQQALDWLLSVLRAEAASSFVYVTRVEVEGFVDPEEDFEELIITQWVELTPEQAMDYWDRLGTAIQERANLLPEYLERIASERVAVRVAWAHSQRAF